MDNLIQAAIRADKSQEQTCDLSLNIQGQTWRAYACNIAHRDIMFLCDKGVATYLVDSYGDRHVAELFDWSEDT